MPTGGQPSLIQNIFQWVVIIIQNVIWPLGLLAILTLALRQFTRWVNYIVPRPERVVEREEKK